MVKRILTSTVGLIVFFGLLFFPESRIPFNCAVCVAVLVMLLEVYKSSDTHILLKLLGFFSGAAILGAIIFDSSIAAVLSICTAVHFVAMIILHGKVNYRNVLSSCILTYYVSFFMGALITIRNQYGVFAVLFVFVCAWMTDTGAYFCGRFFGRHKLIPRVSPKKTVEGAIGGVIICIISVIIYTHVIKLIEANSILYTISLAAVVSVLAQFGDLAASAIKRDCDIKDFGNILPGHGGLMDRFDSVLFIAPFVLYLLKYL